MYNKKTLIILPDTPVRLLKVLNHDIMKYDENVTPVKNK